MTRKTWMLIGAGVVVAVSVTGGVVGMSGAAQAGPDAQAAQTSTVRVERESLSAMLSVNGTLTYRAQPDGSPYLVINQAKGSYTELPDLGQVIYQGQVLYRVDDSPVMLLYGSTPAYRTLSVGSTGADVTELNTDLVALGYLGGGQLSATSAYFGPATTMAVKRLQSALGVTQTGSLGLGQAVFEPTVVRVTGVSVPLGGSTQSGQAVMQATSTTRQVEVALDASQQAEVSLGDKVTITLPNSQMTPGVVSSVGTVATCPSSSPPGQSTAGSAASGTDVCPSSGPGSSTTPTITVGVTPSDPATAGRWDLAPVQVTVTTASVPSALVVPVTALLALSGGGYAVEVVGSGGSDHRVSVSLGLFDDAHGLVQVRGSGLAAGQEVVAPTT